MSSWYPTESKTPEDKQIYAIEQACIWLNRIRDSNVNVDISEINNELWDEKETFEEKYKEKHFQNVLNDYIFNHPEEIQKLIETDSLDEKINILTKCNKNIMNRFGYVKIDKPSYDELESLIMSEVKNMNDSAHEPNFDNIK